VREGEDSRRAGAAPVNAESAPRKLPEPEDFPATGPNALAAPGPRFGARGLDLALVAMPAMIVAALSVEERGDQVEIDLPGWLPWLVLGVGFLYEFATTAIWGRSLGKWLFGLRIARYTDGRRPHVDQALLRSLVPWAAFALPVPFSGALLLGVWFTGIGGGPLHRGVPDQAGGTIVVATR
jgi:uncharacterized RDD family membrane protein YckC